MELILESDSDAHLSEDGDICVQNGSDTGNTDTYITQWSDNTYRWHTVPLAHKFTGDSSGLQRTVTRHRYCCPLSVFMLFFFEVIQVLVVETHFITSTWHVGRKTVLTAWQDCSGNVFVSGDYCVQMGHNQRDTLKDNWLTLEQCFMALYGNTMEHIYSNILSYTYISIF